MYILEFRRLVAHYAADTIAPHNNKQTKINTKHKSGTVNETGPQVT